MFKIKNTQIILRPCYINTVGLCYFHCWGTYTNGETRGIIETEDGKIYCASPESIRFVLTPEEAWERAEKERAQIKLRSKKQGNDLSRQKEDENYGN